MNSPLTELNPKTTVLLSTTAHQGTSINCLTANPKSLKLLESRAHSQ